MILVGGGASGGGRPGYRDLCLMRLLAPRSASGINKLILCGGNYSATGNNGCCDVPHEAPWTMLVQWCFGAEMDCRPIDPPREG